MVDSPTSRRQPDKRVAPSIETREPVAFLNRKLRRPQTGPLELLRRANARNNAPVAGFPLALRFADLEREILAGRHAFFRHREYHRDRHVSSGDSCQIHDLLLAEL